MSKKIIIISSSLRSSSNSAVLADEFAKGAEAAGHQVETINLAGKTINFCKGCLACQKTQKCVIDDDAVSIAENVCSADVIVFSTPVYYYSICGQLKTLLDRMNPLYSSDYQFRSVYLLLTSAETESSAADGSTKDIEGWVECFPKCSLSGVLHAGGVNDANEMKEHSDLLKKAYDMGLQA